MNNTPSRLPDATPSRLPGATPSQLLTQDTTDNVNCVGGWGPYGECDKHYASKIRIYNITTAQKGNGESCSFEHGYENEMPCDINEAVDPVKYVCWRDSHYTNKSCKTDNDCDNNLGLKCVYSECERDSSYEKKDDEQIECTTDGDCSTAKGYICKNSDDIVGCMGASTQVETARGTLALGKLKVGDFVKTRNNEWTKVFWVRDHGLQLVPHLKLTFCDKTVLVLTKDHLVLDVGNCLVRAETLCVDDRIFGSGARVVAIEHVLDVPLTPAVFEGEIVYGGKLVSCWAQNKENAEKMQHLASLAQKFRKSATGLTDEEFVCVCNTFYEEFRSLGKSEEEVPRLLEKAAVVV